MAPLVRYSLQQLELQYKTDPGPLDKVVRAFAALQKKPKEDPDSWFNIAACHGEPRKADEEGHKPALQNWWGGYCAHGNILFPMWHRAYLLRLEEAMRRVPGCEDVSVPFWDECLDLLNPVPAILTQRKYLLDNQEIDNPLYSYKFVAAIVDDQSSVPGDHVPPKMDYRYSKPIGYETTRFPLSGLVGTDEYKKDSEIWNTKEMFDTEEKRIYWLQLNLHHWMKTGVSVTKPSDGKTNIPADRDLKSVYGRFKTCLNTTSYTLFSNTTTERDIKPGKDGRQPSNPGGHMVSLESPHNSIHLATGGFYQKGSYLANTDKFWEENRGANGDMGCNETASFDPIFYFHHAFIDYVFWTWQRKHNKTSEGSIMIDMPDAPGTNTGEAGQPGLPPNTKLTMDTPLYPFKKPGSSEPPSSNDLVDIEHQLNYTYGEGSLDKELEAKPQAVLEGSLASVEDYPDLHAYLEIKNIKESMYPGSFVIRAYATTPSGAYWEIGREAILSRFNTAGCGNCQSKDEAKAYVTVYKDLANTLREGEQNSYSDITYHVDITTSDPSLDWEGFDSARPSGPTIQNILPELRGENRA